MYKTVLEESSDEYIVKKSRFIGYAKPVKTADEAMEFITQIQKKHWNATHNVYAYIIKEGQLQRYSDDGEPQGTAGIPMLDVLKKEGLTDVAVVGTRYFGGIMLGAGGLVRAYSHTAKIAVDAAKIIEVIDCTDCEITVDYTFYGRLVPLLASNSAITNDTDFADNVTVKFSVESDFVDDLRSQIIDVSNGKYNFSEVGKSERIKE